MTMELTQHRFSDASGACHVEIIRCPENLDRWHLVTDYLKIRKQVFVDQMDWPLFHAEDLEFEQYDTFDTIYAVATEHGRVIGGARLRRTDQISGKGRVRYSYMIRDACMGVISGLPAGLCATTPPFREDVWEMTRMVVNGPREVSRLMLRAVNAFLADQGAASVLFLGSPAFARMAKSMDWPVQTLGPIASNKDGSFQVFECPVRAQE
ncbi:hypothetical protein D3P06_06865 [Paracoccus aestuarii]|uniref:Acyl-homoserine-lactone synthase n=1 Tax=Paracoccus aestuarii TaxID=453842 RepID=A0A418ZY60_9RHOB|nr:acyl-homoserine-lactone synthase [Paracoccus aestuarii]RJL05463.1 hypothetical protein D3P06_06865 [Paracoccus aestuarii]WCR01293.1 hypothetical protein JHW48_18205 [Paracoccus aestuarii]